MRSIDGVLGIRPWGHMIEGANESTVLWRPPRETILKAKICEIVTTGMNAQL